MPSRSSRPSVLFPRRMAVAIYASALLAARPRRRGGELGPAAGELPAEDIRSRVVAARVLAATGCLDEARLVAEQAVQLAYATQQVSERAATDAVRTRLG